MSKNIKIIPLKIFYILGSALVTLLGIIFFLFLLSRIIPTDPVLSIVGDNASHATYMASKKALGLDQPVYMQFFIYIKQLSQGDWGVSLMTSHKVIDELLHLFPATLELSTLALLLGTLLGVPLGMVSAFYKNKWLDQSINIFALTLHAIPTFWAALIFLFLFYFTWDVLPGIGRIGISFEDFELKTHFILFDSLSENRLDIFKDALKHLVLPSSVLGLMLAAYITRMTRTFMIEELSQQYILTARAKGLSSYSILRHAFLNIRAPLLTVLALSYGALLEGAVLTETIFAFPGIGLYLNQALKSVDMNAIIGAVLLIGIIYMTINICVDCINTFIDVRVRNKECKQ